MVDLPVEVLLVADRTLPCRGLRDIIDAYPSMCLVAETRSSQDALPHCALIRAKPLVVIVDAATPTIDASMIVADIRVALSSPPPMLCLINGYDDMARELVAEHAVGLLFMHSSPEELEAAVLMRAAGYSIGLGPPPGRTRYSWDADKDAVDGLRCLSEREFEVLKLIAHGYTNTAIADLLELRESTVKSHVQRLLRKVDCRSRAELAVLAYEKCMRQDVMIRSA
ncbi:response regulator transcription factor [Pseudonocardia sp. MH-G8]|uniref:response regulator transcription factor n=1 Tax=Pseudonocardia sp. MH-G8 TaxID=1854588 RepID=UPI000BA0E6CF|nr:response regulator transcription factor [Pseudonocardia sp. MH-G8]OZM83063.1 hypothetical protein CFP66_00320 [Pseudonocardia sp. MH-G8]